MSPTIAIATNTLGAHSETFVTRHVKQLNNGRTVVVCRHIADPSLTNRPVLAIGGRGERAFTRLGNLFHAVWNQLCRGGIAFPDKRVEQIITDFLTAHAVTCILAEFGPLGSIVQGAAARAGIPLYVYFRGRDATSLLARRGVRSAYRRLFPQAAGVFAVSRFLLEALQAQGLSHPNSHVIPSGVDTAAFAPAPKDAGRLLFVGRFVAKKAPDLVLHAFARAAKGRAIRLDMIGDGPLLGACQTLAAKLGVAERVRFLGALPHEAVRAHMASAALFIQHSVTTAQGETEGLPSSIQEAMAAGATVVATRHAGIAEAIASGRNGLLVAEHDLDGCAAAIERLLDNPEMAAGMARQARADAVERFDAKRLMQRLENILLAGNAQENQHA